jgi:glycosyltransferase involved in cell wall biosynthesis
VCTPQSLGPNGSSASGPRRAREERPNAGIDDAAIETLLGVDARARSLPPVAYVIAAYNEQGSIGPVLDELPTRLCGLSATAIVVVDGAKDQTAAEARARGAIVCDIPIQRGQGAALRLGYRIAREGGARYIVTTDADGQYDPADTERVLEPVVSGEADFVSGSRRLGRDETTDPLRRLGVRVFAGTISWLTGHKITDPAFGLRAMRADLTAAIELRQPQYQTAEVLIGVISRGFRAAERPATMRARTAGHTKKGANLLYGLRFARVIGQTFWRERRTAGANRSKMRAP